MKDKRLELKLSVRGDGSLTRNSTPRSSTRSNVSNNSGGLPLNEIFAIDRFSAPQNRSFDILDKHRRQTNQYGYPAQSLPALHEYNQQPRNNRYGTQIRRNPYFDYTEPVDTRPYYFQPQYEFNVEPLQYNPVYNDPSILIHGTLPRRPGTRHDQYKDVPVYAPKNYTLPARSERRRVRISEHEPIVHGYGM